MEQKHGSQQDELLALLEQMDGPDPVAQAAGAWRYALAALREAARTGLPPEQARTRIARELLSVAEWLRVEVPRTPTARQSRVHVVEVGHDLRRRSAQLRVRLDPRLWSALGRPPFLHLVGAGQVRFQINDQPGATRHYVRPQGRRVVLYCETAELPGLAEGRYAAEVLGDAIVIGAALNKAGAPADPGSGE